MLSKREMRSSYTYKTLADFTATYDNLKRSKLIEDYSITVVKTNVRVSGNNMDCDTEIIVKIVPIACCENIKVRFEN